MNLNQVAQAREFMFGVPTDVLRPMSLVAQVARAAFTSYAVRLHRRHEPDFRGAAVASSFWFDPS